MTIYQCDFCKETRPCTKTTIDGKRYDICRACTAKRDEQLKDCGEYKPDTWPRTITITTPVGTTTTWGNLLPQGNLCQ